ncbi:MAG: DUF177 domain-containing protein [Nitriliruptoraceae bacterium]|nr:DUF177 domain-containing protein [Nitriliruptoraceae bacterium]
MRIVVTDLVGHPGETRAVDTAVPASAFGDDPWGPTVDAVRDPIGLDLHLDSVVEGILVRGTIHYDVQMPCGRCLVPQDEQVDANVTELFLDPAKREEDEEDDPGYELIDDATALDLSTLARDALVIDLPLRVLCREDCQGLCPTCGGDRNLEDCGHRDEPLRDPRWSALADLELPRE